MFIQKKKIPSKAKSINQFKTNTLRLHLLAPVKIYKKTHSWVILEKTMGSHAH